MSGPKPDTHLIELGIRAYIDGYFENYADRSERRRVIESRCRKAGYR